MHKQFLSYYVSRGYYNKEYNYLTNRGNIR